MYSIVHTYHSFTAYFSTLVSFRVCRSLRSNSTCYMVLSFTYAHQCCRLLVCCCLCCCPEEQFLARSSNSKSCRFDRSITHLPPCSAALATWPRLTERKRTGQAVARRTLGRRRPLLSSALAARSHQRRALSLRLTDQLSVQYHAH
jgi:hypothetical protein